MPPSNELALPMVLMMVLTLLVWIILFVRRLGYLSRNSIDADKLRTPAQVAALIPAEDSSPAHNLNNLVELPVVFYALCLYLSLFAQVDPVHVYCAWIFVGFRALHSVIHCSYNRVMHRFLAYLVATLALWVMVVRALLAAI